MDCENVTSCILCPTASPAGMFFSGIPILFNMYYYMYVLHHMGLISPKA